MSIKEIMKELSLESSKPTQENGWEVGSSEASEHPISRHIFNLNENQEILNDVQGLPIDLSAIPNCMGINLCAVDSIEWTRLRDEGRQLVDLKINFLPAIDPDVPPEE